MPKLNTKLHLSMFRSWKIRTSPIGKLLRSIKLIKAMPRDNPTYGYQWGDPDSRHDLMHVRDHWILSYVNKDHLAVEIGPGGGRWTKYLLEFKTLYVVDYYSALLNELKKNFNEANMYFILNNGTDFPTIADKSVDYVFSFGTFVHLDLNIIDEYLVNIRRIIRSGGNVVIQYSDKTKEMCRKNLGFSENTPEKMRKLVSQNGFNILEEDLTSLEQSSIIRFTI